MIDAGETPDGRIIKAVTLDNGTLRASVVTFGASVRDLRLAGVDRPLILGLDDPQAYPEGFPYLGAIVGRVANRIAHGQAEIAGEMHRFDRNEGGKRTLHGGADGSGRRLWTLVEAGPAHVILADRLADGHMGFPGALDVQVRYALVDAALEVEITATTDAPTLCNFAPHMFFNLSGAATMDDHLLFVDADRYQAVDEGQIPDRPPQDVSGTPFDLRGGAMPPEGIDHNFCLSEERRGAPHPAAILRAGDVEMRLESTEPGLQVYDGGGLRVSAGTGLDGRGYGPRAGVALEPQAWVDAANQGMRAQVDLFPGETYRQFSRFAFAQV
ncbi:galactose mutarotase [Roseivivax marinus]|uniref:aldose epimerase family protein n=1 Tax=Roseivivax marinus TaxID=1379903 RepID=UPI001F036964|nr:aldose epimerase family protein [Roseivivax marinus]UMA66091.1 galactose mutarotase [Roseivivax marinus]